MAYASQAGRARTSARSPQAHAICDRCGFRYNLVDLSWQFDWRGASLQNIKLLVCNGCNDDPQQQLRAIVIPADPMPVANPRTQDFVTAETNTRVTSGLNTVDPRTGLPIQGGNTRVTSLSNVATSNQRTTQQTGEPPGGSNQSPGTDPNAVTYRTVTGAINNGSGLIRLTVATTNGMITGQYVTVQDVGGVSAANANWTITVIDSTNVDLQGSVFAGTYTSGGYLINNPSLPYNFTEVPKTGPLT